MPEQAPMHIDNDSTNSAHYHNIRMAIIRRKSDEEFLSTNQSLQNMKNAIETGLSFEKQKLFLKIKR